MSIVTPTPDEATATAADRWVILLVQSIAPSERFIGPFTRAEAEAWVGQAVENGVTWVRLVVAPLEVPYAV